MWCFSIQLMNNVHCEHEWNENYLCYLFLYLIHSFVVFVCAKFHRFCCWSTYFFLFLSFFQFWLASFFVGPLLQRKIDLKEWPNVWAHLFLFNLKQCWELPYIHQNDNASTELAVGWQWWNKQNRRRVK